MLLYYNFSLISLHHSNYPTSFKPVDKELEILAQAINEEKSQTSGDQIYIHRQEPKEPHSWDPECFMHSMYMYLTSCR